jgi:hypothetical protein
MATMQRPLVDGKTSTQEFITELGAFLGMPVAEVALVNIAFREKGKWMVQQVKESPKAVVEECCGACNGLFEVLCVYIVPEGEDKHVFEEPAGLLQRSVGSASYTPPSTGGACGNCPDRQFEKAAIQSPGVSFDIIHKMENFPQGVLDGLNRHDNSTPVTKSQVKLLVRNMANLFILLFGCLYLISDSGSSASETDALPKAYMTKVCRLVREHFVKCGFQEDKITSAVLYKKLSHRVHLTAL